MVTYRKAPEDIDEAKYIKGLIDADISARIGELTKDLPTLHGLLSRQKKWGEIVEDITAEDGGEKVQKKEQSKLEKISRPPAPKP